MVSQIDDLAETYILLSSSDFKNAFNIDYKNETESNYEFVRAFNNVLNGSDHKKALYDWGMTYLTKV